MSCLSRKTVALLFLLLGTPVGGVLGGVPAEAQSSGFRVIVHESNPVTSLSKQEVSRLFLKRMVRWPNGELVQPVDQTTTSPVRERFSTEVHGRHVSAITAHWQRLIFQGRDVPPPIRPSESAVVDFVSSNPHAIGYVSSNPPRDAGIKVVTLTD